MLQHRITVHLPPVGSLLRHAGVPLLESTLIPLALYFKDGKAKVEMQKEMEEAEAKDREEREKAEARQNKEESPPPEGAHHQDGRVPEGDKPKAGPSSQA